MSHAGLDNLIVFHGALHPETAYVYAQLAAEPAAEALQLRGAICGPRSRHTRTLPATIPFTELEPGPTRLARAPLPDPCFWEPGRPYLYEVSIELCAGADVVDSARRSLGLRRLGTVGSRLHMGTDPWDLAAWYPGPDASDEAGAELDAGLALYLDAPDEAVCRDTTERGVLLVVEDHAVSAELLEANVRRYGQWASVAMVVVRNRACGTEQLQAVAPNLLLADYFAADEMVRPASWAHVAVCEWRPGDDLVERTAECAIPVVVRQAGTGVTTPDEAVRRNRQLSAELASGGRIAGTLV